MSKLFIKDIKVFLCVVPGLIKMSAMTQLNVLYPLLSVV